MIGFIHVLCILQSVISDKGNNEQNPVCQINDSVKQVQAVEMINLNELKASYHFILGLFKDPFSPGKNL